MLGFALPQPLAGSCPNDNVLDDMARLAEMNHVGRRGEFSQDARTADDCGRPVAAHLAAAPAAVEQLWFNIEW